MNELAFACSRQWKIDVNESIDIFSLAINKIKNLTIVFKVMDDDISGACLKLENENIIFVNSRHSKGRQAFTIAHELYHLKYDGNTIVVEEPTELIKRLNSMGIEVSVEHYDRSKTHKVFKNEFIVEDWVLTRIGGQHAT